MARTTTAIRRLAGSLVVVLALARGGWAASPLEPAEALAQFELEAGLAIELAACEPAVVDPIAVRFDEDGRMWVVEMRDYPHGPEKGQPPLSRISILTDADGDGRFESSRVFAEELLFPTGLQPWQGGAIVTLAGEVAYFKDTDGDGRADRRETWFRGFAEENPQLRANHPRLALDNRVYVANGLRGGTVVDARRKDAPPLEIGGRDFCFDPRTGDCEAVSGNGQFGLTFDAWGHRFVCSNRQPLDHVVLENRYLARNPFLATPSVLSPVAAAGEASRVYPLTSAWTTSNLHAGQFTAACGATIYQDDALGGSLKNSALVCEPTGSLVHREIVRPSGATFASRPAQQGREFLASRDAWFRPVNLEVGPDGALYVVDMYRAVIEHPQFMPSELQQRPDLRLGDDRGRIYRIVPSGATGAKPPAVRLSQAATAELVGHLETGSSWWRETAARLLYERQDASAAAELARVAADGRPEARVAALGALAGLGALSKDTLSRAIAADEPRVRELAVTLAESLLAQGTTLRAQVMELSSDADAQVRFRTALALGGVARADVVTALAKIALADADDPWTRQAVAAALPEHAVAVLEEVLGYARAGGSRALVLELAAVVGARREPAEIERLLALLSADPGLENEAHRAALEGLATGLERRGTGLVAFVAALPNHDVLTQALEGWFARAAAGAADEMAGDDARGAQFAILRHARGAPVVEACLGIVESSGSQRARIEAAGVLARQNDERIAPAVLRLYAAQTPAVRRALLDCLIARPDAARLLLEAVRSQAMARAELDTGRQQQLRRHRDESLRKLAAEVLAENVAADRQAVLAQYQPALDRASDPRAGKELFRQHCAVCHHIDDVGVDVAPDISDSRVKTAAQLLTDILHPNQAIDNNYVSYTVTTVDGNIHTGIVAAETAGSITLRQAENKTVSLLRADVEEIRASGVSLMPEGFEKHLDVQQMADLLGFIKNWRYLAEPIPGTIAPSGAKSGS